MSPKKTWWEALVEILQDAWRKWVDYRAQQTGKHAWTTLEHGCEGVRECRLCGRKERIYAGTWHYYWAACSDKEFWAKAQEIQAAIVRGRMVSEYLKCPGRRGKGGS